MNEKSTKVADLFEKDINKLCEDINFVIEAHNKLLDERDEYKQKIDKAIEYIKENACYDKETKKCNDDLNYNECDELLEILGDKE